MNWLEHFEEEEAPIGGLSDLSPYQEDIISWARGGSGNGAVDAKAGSGKTYTIVQICKALPRSLKVLYAVFNKHNQLEAQKKVPSHCAVKTCHSFGMSAIYSNAYSSGASDKPVMDEKKLDTIMDEVIDDEFRRSWRYPAARLVKLAKNYLTDDHERLRFLAYHHGVEIPFHWRDDDDWEDLLTYVTDALRLCRERDSVFDFDDMIWLPVVNGYRTRKFDMVIVDEAQDLNNCQIALLASALRRDSRLLVVGDPHQAIYGFRGSDHEIFEKLVDRFNCRTLPLSITYRCPNRVVEEAQALVPEIEAAPDAIEGEVRDVLYEDAMIELESLYGEHGEIDPGREDLVLCRTMAPLVIPCFDLIRAGVKAQIRGRDIGKNLVKLVQKYKAKSLEELMTKLETYRAKMLKKYTELDQMHLFQRVHDQVDTISAIADYVDTVTDLVARIRAIFSEDLRGVTFSTIHRAKGCEASHVWILSPHLLPHPMARKDWEKTQEKNLEYVAITRAKESLAYIRGEP